MAISARSRSAKSRAPTVCSFSRVRVLPRMDTSLGGRPPKLTLTLMKGRGSSVSSRGFRVLMLKSSRWKSSTASSGMMTQKVRAELPKRSWTPAKLRKRSLAFLMV
nr:MAG TPA: hypothetical protein [Caudoviricetes sp.]